MGKSRSFLRYIFTVVVLAVWTCLFCAHIHAAQPFELHLLDVGQEAGSDAREFAEEVLYVCNTNTKKFHYPGCDSVNQMNESNRMNTNLSRDELIAQGYQPCGNCHP